MMILTKNFDFPRVLQDLLRVAAYDDPTREIPSVVFDIGDVLQPTRGDALVVSILRRIKNKLSQWHHRRSSSILGANLKVQCHEYLTYLTNFFLF
jgi:hypothetical protein